MSQIRSIVLCFVLLFASNELKAQTLTVLSTEKTPLSGVSVLYRDLPSGKEISLLTDSLGQVRLGLNQTNLPLPVLFSHPDYEKLKDTIRTLSDRVFVLNAVQSTLDEVVVTAQYAPGSAENAVHKIRVLDAKKIEAMAAQNLRDVLTNELNIRISQDNILGSSMSLQGISGQNIKILVDGVPLTGRLNGNIDLSQINLNNVERIEIIEGPLSVSYGTDALGGTINIIMKKSQRSNLSLDLGSFYESTGQYNYSAKTGIQKARHTLALSGGRNFFDGWRSSDPAFLVEKVRPADSLRFRDWKQKEQYFSNLFYTYRFKRANLGFTSDYFHEKITNRGLPRLPYFETAFDEYYKTLRLSQVLNASGQLSKNYRFQVLTSYTVFRRIKNTFFKDLTTLEESLSATPGEQDTSRFNNLMSRGSISGVKDSAKFNFELGYDLNLEKATGIRIAGQEQQFGDYALFASAEIKPFQGLVIRPGLRLTHNTAYQAPLIPSLNLRYALLKMGKSRSLTLRASYAKGFRAPSLKELYFYFVDINHNITGNPDLKAENSHNFNLSLHYSSNKKQSSHKSELSCFYNTLTDMISLAQKTATEYSYFNIDEFKTLGIQAQSEYSRKGLSFLLGAAWIGRYNQFAAENAGERFIYSPEIKSNIRYEWPKRNISLNFFYKYTGKLPSYMLNSENEIFRTTMQDYHTADLSLSKQLRRKQLYLSIGAKNLFDVRNINGVMSGSPHSSGTTSVPVAMGRTYFVKLDIHLQSGKR